MWEPWRLTTLWASTACYKDSFTFRLPLPYAQAYGLQMKPTYILTTVLPGTVWVWDPQKPRVKEWRHPRIPPPQLHDVEHCFYWYYWTNFSRRYFGFSPLTLCSLEKCFFFFVRHECTFRGNFSFDRTVFEGLRKMYLNAVRNFLREIFTTEFCLIFYCYFWRWRFLYLRFILEYWTCIRAVSTFTLPRLLCFEAPNTMLFLYVSLNNYSNWSVFFERLEMNC
jgi:hypothetical protein